MAVRSRFDLAADVREMETRNRTSLNSLLGLVVTTVALSVAFPGAAVAEDGQPAGAAAPTRRTPASPGFELPPRVTTNDPGCIATANRADQCTLGEDVGCIAVNGPAGMNTPLAGAPAPMLSGWGTLLSILALGALALEHFRGGINSRSR